MAFFALPALAQNKPVKGTVVDQNNEPIIGATVVVVGNTQNGTITDMDGKFTLNVPAGKKIKISYIGYQPQTIAKFDGPLNIVLQEDENTLDDVVVVGYGACPYATSPLHAMQVPTKTSARWQPNWKAMPSARKVWFGPALATAASTKMISSILFIRQIGRAHV